MAFINKWFGKTETLPDFSALQVDLHSHLIAGVDDGSNSIDESLQMLRKFQRLGYSKVITTPHIMTDYYRNTPEIILGGLSDLKQELDKTDIDIEVEVAAEYYIDHEFQEKLEQNEEFLTFGDRYILVEFSFQDAPLNLEQILFDLQIARYKPVLAHVERFAAFHRNKQIFQKLKDKGIFFQLNLISLAGYYSKPVKTIAEYLIKNEMIEFAGSDAHGMRHLEALDSIRSNKYAIELIKSGRLLNNELL